MRIRNPISELVSWLQPGNLHVVARKVDEKPVAQAAASRQRASREAERAQLARVSDARALPVRALPGKAPVRVQLARVQLARAADVKPSVLLLRKNRVDARSPFPVGRQ